MKCWECAHFKIQYEPLHGISGLYDFGRAKCEKHDLIVDFPNHRKLKKLECVEKPPKEDADAVSRFDKH